MDTVNVLILYGGEAATEPRDKLLDWLNSQALHRQIGKRVDARKVAAMVAHMEGSIDQRVEEMMNWAHKGIFLLTPDKRSDYGAPNVLEEFGRWIGQKGRRTMLALRHEDVQVHSNASGLVYVGFKNDVVNECRDRLVAFINDQVPITDSSNASVQEPPTQSSNHTINSGQTFNIGSVGGNLTGGDSVGGNVYHISGDYHAGPASPQAQGNKSSNSQSSSVSPNSTGETVEVLLTDLREFLSNKYGKQDLIYLIQQMGMDSDDFASSKTGLILDLLPYLQRRDQLNDLLDLLAKDSAKRLQKEFGDGSKFVISS